MYDCTILFLFDYSMRQGNLLQHARILLSRAHEPNESPEPNVEFSLAHFPLALGKEVLDDFGKLELAGVSRFSRLTHDFFHRRQKRGFLNCALFIDENRFASPPRHAVKMIKSNLFLFFIFVCTIKRI